MRVLQATAHSSGAELESGCFASHEQTTTMPSSICRAANLQEMHSGTKKKSLVHVFSSLLFHRNN